METLFGPVFQLILCPNTPKPKKSIISAIGLIHESCKLSNKVN